MNWLKLGALGILTATMAAGCTIKEGDGGGVGGFGNIGGFGSTDTGGAGGTSTTTTSSSSTTTTDVGIAITDTITLVDPLDECGTCLRDKCGSEAASDLVKACNDDGSGCVEAFACRWNAMPVLVDDNENGQLDEDEIGIQTTSDKDAAIIAANCGTNSAAVSLFECIDPPQADDVPVPETDCSYICYGN